MIWICRSKVQVQVQYPHHGNQCRAALGKRRRVGSIYIPYGPCAPVPSTQSKRCNPSRSLQGSALSEPLVTRQTTASSRCSAHTFPKSRRYGSRHPPAWQPRLALPYSTSRLHTCHPSPRRPFSIISITSIAQPKSCRHCAKVYHNLRDLLSGAAIPARPS